MQDDSISFNDDNDLNTLLEQIQNETFNFENLNEFQQQLLDDYYEDLIKKKLNSLTTINPSLASLFY